MTDAKERNSGHPNGEEHRRIPKGNRGTRRNNIIGLIGSGLSLMYLVGNNITGVGAADDMLLIPTVTKIWDYARAVFA